jgi:N-hydroxyarylamine O-acetyltransferase
VLEDFTIGAWWNSTSPASHFVRSLVCSRVTEDGGRITLSGSRLTVTSPDGRKEVSELEGDEEVLEVYQKEFGMVLDRVPKLQKAGQSG